MKRSKTDNVNKKQKKGKVKAQVKKPPPPPPPPPPPEPEPVNTDSDEDYEIGAMMDKLDISKEARRKLELQMKLEEIHERIRLALENVGMESNLHCTASEIFRASQTQSGQAGWDPKAQRKKMHHQHTLLSMIAEFLSSCQHRKSLMSEISEWMVSCPQEGSGFPSQTEMQETEKEEYVIHQNIKQAVQIAQRAGNQLKNIGLKLISEVRNVDRSEPEIVKIKTPSPEPEPFRGQGVIKKEERNVYDEDSLLEDTTNWHNAAKDIKMILEDMLRQVRGVNHKNNIRFTLKQFKMMTAAMLRRCSEMKKMDEEMLQMGMKIERLTNATVRVEEENKKLIKKNNTLDGQIAAMEKQVQGIREENMSLKDNIDDLSAEREDMKKKLSKPKSRVTIVTSVHRVSKSQEELHAAELAALHEQLQMYQLEFSDQQGEIEILQKKLRDEQGKVEMVEAKLENAQRLAKEKQKIVARLGGDTTFKMKTLNDENDSLEKQVIQLKSELACKNEIIEHQEQRLAEMSEDVNIWSTAVETGGTLPGLPNIPAKEAKKESRRGSSMPASEEVKRLVLRVKQDFQVEVNRLKDHIDKEKQRKEADVRRLGNSHREQLLSIHKESIHILRSINRFKESVAQIFDRENLVDAAHDIRLLNNLNTEEAPVDPKALLSQMAGAAVELLVALEFKLSQSLMNKRLEIKANTLARAFATKDLEYQIEVAQRAKQMSESLGEKFKEAQEKLEVNEKILKTIKEKENKRYQAVVDRYDHLWNQYRAVHKDMLKLQKDCAESLKNKDSTLKSIYSQKQNFEKMVKAQDQIILKMKPNILKRCRNEEERYRLSIRDQHHNLAMLEKAFHSNDISHKIYAMTVGLIKKIQQVPILRLRHLVERYVAHCKLRKTQGKLEDQLTSTISNEKRRELTHYLSKVDQQLQQCSSEWQQRIEEIEAQRRRLFEEMSQSFGEVLVLHGMSLNIPTKMPQQLPRSQAAPQQQEVTLPRIQDNKPLVTVGTNYGESESTETYWNVPDPSNLNMHVASDIPKVMDMDINSSIRGAKKKLARQRRLMQISHAETVEFSDRGVVSLSNVTVSSDDISLNIPSLTFLSKGL